MRTYTNDGPDKVHGPYSKDTMETMCDNFEAKGITYSTKELQNGYYTITTNEVASDYKPEESTISFRMVRDRHLDLKRAVIGKYGSVAELMRELAEEWLEEQG